MNLHRFPLGRPDLGILPGDNPYPFQLNSDFVYCWPGHRAWKAMDICVPRGYLTDLLSIPRLLWPVLSPFGAGCWGALPHDILYSSEFSLPEQSPDDARAMHDRILYDAAIDSGASRWRASVLYSGVRVGGWVSWRNHVESEVTDDLVAMAEATERWLAKK